MSGRRTALAAAVLAGLALAGCGGGPSREEYQAKVAETRNRVDDALAFITAAQSREQLLDRMSQAAVSVEKAADELADFGAAEGFGDENERLVAALRQLAVDLDATADQARQPGFEGLLGRGVSFESWTRANAVLRDLRRQGLDVRPLDRH